MDVSVNILCLTICCLHQPLIATWAATWLETTWLDDSPATCLMQHWGGFDIIVDLVKNDNVRLARKLSATIRSLDICAPAALRSIARRHVAGGCSIIVSLAGAEIPRVCLSLSNTVATFTQALAVSLAHALMKRPFLVAAVLAKPARCRDAELDTFRDASRTHHTPQLVRATDAFFCFSYPSCGLGTSSLRWMSSLSTQLWRTTSPSCRSTSICPLRPYGSRMATYNGHP